MNFSKAQFSLIKTWFSSHWLDMKNSWNFSFNESLLHGNSIHSNFAMWQIVNLGVYAIWVLYTLITNTWKVRSLTAMCDVWFNAKHLSSFEFRSPKAFNQKQHRHVTQRQALPQWPIDDQAVHMQRRPHSLDIFFFSFRTHRQMWNANFSRLQLTHINKWCIPDSNMIFQCQSFTMSAVETLNT